MMYHAGEWLVLCIDPQKSCYVVEAQQAEDSHIKVMHMRDGQLTAEWLRIEDVMPLALREVVSNESL